MKEKLLYRLSGASGDRCGWTRLTVICTVQCIRGAGSDGSFLPVFAGRWLDWLLLARFWLLFGCFGLQDRVSGRLLLRNPATLLGLLLLLRLLLRLGSLQQPELHPQLDDGLPLLVNRLVQVVVLYLLITKRTVRAAPDTGWL